MKNIRILEDGNRLIVVLEGYEKSAVKALMEVLEAAVTPLSHISPHTGEAQFQMKGTEKEVQLIKQEKEAPIKPPAFMEKMKKEEGKEAEPFVPPVLSNGTMTTLGYGIDEETADVAGEKVTAETLTAAETAKAGGKDFPAGSMTTKVKTSQKPAECMNSFELRAYIQQTDKKKLSMLLQKKGRFPNMMHLLNADDRTIREYVKELLLTV
ncbi:MAG: hypothetical protein HFG50_10760 [Lachnospiraceae bacterium]|jgi:hypothetical protein|nr:hypothetical protein [Lachnospiraceae bacterium]